MKVLPRTKFGNPILRAKAEKVPLSELKTKYFKNLIERMFYTMKQAHGIGLAAPQISKSIQLFVAQISPTKLRPNLKPLPKTIAINPKIIQQSKEMEEDWEGCLSCPTIRGKVPRHKKITVVYYDEFGEKQTVRLEGLQARLFQHEIDHLNGNVYVDRMKDMKSLMTLSEFEERILKKRKK